MVLDTSALLAILLGEPDAAVHAQCIATASRRLLSAISALETGLVIEARKGEPGGRELDLLLHRARIEIVPFTAEHYELARMAWRRFGKGRHPAALNMGDCCTYALARHAGEPLLCKGADFARTDLRLVTLPHVAGPPAVEPP